MKNKPNNHFPSSASLMLQVYHTCYSRNFHSRNWGQWILLIFAFGTGGNATFSLGTGGSDFFFRGYTTYRSEHELGMTSGLNESTAWRSQLKSIPIIRPLFWSFAARWDFEWTTWAKRVTIIEREPSSMIESWGAAHGVESRIGFPSRRGIMVFTTERIEPGHTVKELIPWRLTKSRRRVTSSRKWRAREWILKAKWTLPREQFICLRGFSSHRTSPKVTRFKERLLSVFLMIWILQYEISFGGQMSV